MTLINSSFIASGDNGGNVKIWNIFGASIPTNIFPHSPGSIITSLVMLNDNLLASGSFDRVVNIWDLRAVVAKNRAGKK